MAASWKGLSLFSCCVGGDVLARAALTWLFQGSEDGFSIGVLRICELYHAVVLRLVQAKHASRVLRVWCGEGETKQQFQDD